MKNGRRFEKGLTENLCNTRSVSLCICSSCSLQTVSGHSSTLVCTSTKSVHALYEVESDV